MAKKKGKKKEFIKEPEPVSESASEPTLNREGTGVRVVDGDVCLEGSCAPVEKA